MATVIDGLLDYLRDLDGNGIDGASWQVVRLIDNSVIASGNTAPDTEPLTDLSGLIVVPAEDLGYPGPIKYVITDAVVGTTRIHTSKSTGIVGPLRLCDLPYAFAMMIDGPIERIGAACEVTATGAGGLELQIGDGVVIGHGLIWVNPTPIKLNLNAAGAVTRTDLVVVRFRLPGHAEEGRIDPVIRGGIPGLLPPFQDDVSQLLWDVPLAQIKVDPGMTVIPAANITDRRTFTYGPNNDSRYLRKDVADIKQGKLTINGLLLIRSDDGTVNYVYLDEADHSFQLRNQTDFMIYKGNGTTLSFGVDGLSGQLRVGDDKPSVNVHAALGSGAVGTVEWGNDLMCEINLKAGANPGVGDLCTVVFKRDRVGTKYGAWLQPQDANAAETDAYVSNRSVDGFHIFSRGPLKPSANHSYMIIMGGAQ